MLEYIVRCSDTGKILGSTQCLTLIQESMKTHEGHCKAYLSDGVWSWCDESVVGVNVRRVYVSAS